MRKIIIIVSVLIIVGGGAFLFFNGSTEKNLNNGSETQCEFNEMVFYYSDTCSWCQKVKRDGTITNLEELNIRVEQVNVKIDTIRHQFSGVPTFVINEKIYSGYKTFKELKELLNCSEKEEIPL
ncbi:glutaredoxin family protein [Patescibacteria group bacterium]